ncbi:MAG: SCO family protein [Burkholderiales bacterium]
MKPKRALLLASAALALVLGVFAAVAMLKPDAPPKFEAVDITGVDWGKDFKLTDHAGRARTLADFRGKAVAMFFGFTHCPDMCPTAMAELAEVVKLLGDEARRVQVLFVTVDPKRDTPAVLSQYVPAFHASFLGLYGDAAATERTAKEFKVYYHANPANQHGAYSVDHSGQILVFDPQGRLRLMMKPDLSPEAMARDLHLLLKASRR